tara:strand:+ start:4278 stop:5432 length:1155 start_codon:yes stop_codon:yes gene_type:complete
MATRGTLKARAKREAEAASQSLREATSEGNTVADSNPKPEAVASNESAQFNKNKQDKLRYPLRDQDLYQGQIKFRVVELSPLTASALSNLGFVDELFSADSFSKLDEKIDKDESNTSSEEKQKRQVQGSKTLQKLKGSDSKSYDNPAAQKKYAGSVILYLPQQLAIQDGVTYNSSAALGTIGAGVEGGLKGGASALNAVGAGLTQGLDSFTDLFKGAGLDKDASALALTKTAEALGTQEIAAGVKSATRVSVNPNLRTLLESVPIRSQAFSFRLVAQSQDEAKEIEQIIKFFRYQMYPDEITGQIGGASVSLGYKFPDPFEITATYKNKQVGTKFLDAYLSQMSVTYNENSAAFHADGYPSDVTMSLTFQESKALTRKLVEEGF